MQLSANYLLQFCEKSTEIIHAFVEKAWKKIHASFKIISYNFVEKAQKNPCFHGNADF